MGTRQESVRKVNVAPEPAAVPPVVAPRTGEKFSDEELHARFGVPTEGGIRVSHEKRCIILVDLAVNSKYNDVDDGGTISYMGQDSDREGMLNQEMSNNNLALSRSKEEGYTILYFTQEWENGDLRFDSYMEYDSHSFEFETKADRHSRRVIRFKLRRGDWAPDAVARMIESVGKRREAKTDRADMAMHAASACSGDGDAAPGMSGTAECAMGIVRTAQHAIRETSRAGTPSHGLRRADRLSAITALREVHARPELDSDSVGTYMRDAIEHGGYRAALEHYGAEPEKSETPLYRLRIKGWLLGRLGLYGRMKSWLEEGAAWPDFDHIFAAVDSAPRAAYRTPSLWLETPKPVQRSADRIMTLEPAAAVCRDPSEVPDYIWTAMLILSTTGPICSHAGLGAAAHLVAAGAEPQARDPAHGVPLYDPRRGARLHGAPAGCHRWIIADIDFDPRPPNEPHYYYDLTDEGRAALAAARSSGPPWQKAAEAAAAGLGGMTVPDLLENACRRSGPLRDLDKMKGELGGLVNAWRAQDDGKDVPPVSAEDRALVDLGLTAKWFEDGETSGSSLDYLLHLTTIIDSTRAMACDAKPSTPDESAVLQTLIAAIQDTCRRHGRAVTAAMSLERPSATATRANHLAQEGGTRRRPLYADAAPAMISDLYYCLAEYCKSRRLAVDPCSLPLSEALDEDERAVAAEALQDDSLFHSGSD